MTPLWISSMIRSPRETTSGHDETNKQCTVYCYLLQLYRLYVAIGVVRISCRLQACQTRPFSTDPWQSNLLISHVGAESAIDDRQIPLKWIVKLDACRLPLPYWCWPSCYPPMKLQARGWPWLLDTVPALIGFYTLRRREERNILHWLIKDILPVDLRVTVMLRERSRLRPYDSHAWWVATRAWRTPCAKGYKSTRTPVTFSQRSSKLSVQLWQQNIFFWHACPWSLQVRNIPKALLRVPV